MEEKQRDIVPYHNWTILECLYYYKGAGEAIIGSNQLAKVPFNSNYTHEYTNAFRS